MLYFLTQILTELLSNNAVAVIVTPVAIALAHSLGLDPRPLVVAVMFAATLAFATPIGYQTNTMVYGPGGYKFIDFTRIGLPLNIVTGVTACLLIPVFWPLVPAEPPRWTLRHRGDCAIVASAPARRERADLVATGDRGRTRGNSWPN